MRFRGIGVRHHLGTGGLGQIAGDVPPAQDPADLGDVERPIPEGDAARLLQSLREHVDLIRPVIAVAVDDRIHLALGARADEDDAGRPGRHLAGVGHAGRIHRDLKSRRQRDVPRLGRHAGQEAGQVPTAHRDQGQESHYQEQHGNVRMAHGCNCAGDRVRWRAGPQGSAPATSAPRVSPPARRNASRWCIRSRG